MLRILILMEIIYILNKKLSCYYIYYILIYWHKVSNKKMTCNPNNTTSNAKNPEYTKGNTNLNSSIGNSDISNLDMTNASTLGMPNTPTLGMPNAPTLDMPNAPTSDMANAPTLDMTNAPTLGISNARIHKTLCNIPVILCEYTLDIPLEHNLNFSEKVLKIRNIKNHVSLNNYNILCENAVTPLDSSYKYHIFINGVLTRNIEYSCYEGLENSCIKTSVKELIKQIPFQSKSMCCVNSPIKSSAKASIQLKEVSINEINSISNGQPVLQEFFQNMYSINHLESKILLKLHIDLIKKEQVYI